MNHSTIWNLFQIHLQQVTLINLIGTGGRGLWLLFVFISHLFIGNSSIYNFCPLKVGEPDIHSTFVEIHLFACEIIIFYL